MIGIGSTNIYIDTPRLSREELEEYSKSLFEEWEAYVQAHLQLSDYSLALSVEDGSVKTLGKIGVGLYALYIGIGQYGSFISGVQILKQQVSDASEYLGRLSVEPFSNEIITPKIQKRGEALTRLEGIFKKVERGEITTMEAMDESKLIFGGFEDVPAFFEGLEDALNDVPIHPHEDQLQLIFPDEEPIPIEKMPTSKRQRSPEQPMPPVDHYRVEVWRDSRKDQLNVRVSKA